MNAGDNDRIDLGNKKTIMAFQKIVYGLNSDTDRLSKAAAALALAKDNEYIFGLSGKSQLAPDEEIKQTRHPLFGNTNEVTGDKLDGDQNGIFAQSDNAGNQVMSKNTSGQLDSQTSMTTEPQVDPEILTGDAADRMKKLADGIQYAGLNNRSQIMSI